MKTYVISLNQPTKLLQQLTKYNFNVELFNGINGNLIDLNKIKLHFNSIWFYIAPPSTLGCAISHLQVWKKFIKTKQKYCLILEDDVIFDNSFHKKNVVKILKHTPSDFDLLYLGCFDSNIFKYAMTLVSNSGSFEKINKYVNKPAVALATHSYILSRKGCKKLIKLLDGNINNHIDFCIQNLNKDKLINAYSCNHKLIYQTSTDSNYSLHTNKNNLSTNVINKHPMFLQNILSKIYIDDHVTCDYLFTCSFMKIGSFTFNLTSILFLLLGIIFYRINYSLLSMSFFILSLPEILSRNVKSSSLHYFLLILPKLFTN